MSPFWCWTFDHMLTNDNAEMVASLMSYDPHPSLVCTWAPEVRQLSGPQSSCSNREWYSSVTTARSYLQQILCQLWCVRAVGTLSASQPVP